MKELIIQINKKLMNINIVNAYAILILIKSK